MEATQREFAGRLGAILAHPLRLAILEQLVEGPHIVSDLVEALGAPQPVISKHLGILRDAGLLACEADGRCRIYRLANAQAVGKVLAALGAMAAKTRTGVGAPNAGG